MTREKENQKVRGTREELERSLDFHVRVNSIIHKIHGGGNFAEIMPEIEEDILELLHAERVTVYQRSRSEKELVSKYKSGDEVREIKIPLNVNSMAGYVALYHKPIIVEDVHDSQALQRIHPNLRFGGALIEKKTGYKTRSALTVPIKPNEVLLGIVQVINRKDGRPFEARDLNNAMKLAEALGQKFRYEFEATGDPYEHLVKTDKIRPSHLEVLKERAAAEKVPLTRLLLTEGGVTRAALGQSLERYHQVPFMSYDPVLEVPEKLLQGLNETYLRKQYWLPVAGSYEEVTILMANPSDSERLMEIQEALPAKRYVFRVGLEDDIIRYLKERAGDLSDADLYEQIEEMVEYIEEGELEKAAEGGDESETKVISLVNTIIRKAYEAEASDVHIEPSKSEAYPEVRIRVDGVCHHLMRISPSLYPAVVSRIKIMSNLDISEHRKPLDGKCAVRFRDAGLELRVATLPTVNGESVVLRLLPPKEALPMEKLNLSERNLKEILRLSAHPHGLFLVVGPTGSGKTTTLHAILARLNSVDRKIWTAEDPVEITQDRLQQVQMLPKIGLTFEQALRSFLRADPDIIMVGEMRDRETAHIGVEACLTGHLVFSTLHTNSAPETVVRLLDLGVDPMTFSDALLCILAQRLARTLCAKCKKPSKASEKEYHTLAMYYGEEHFEELGVGKDDLHLYRAVGCEACGNTGYKGRTGLHELLVATDGLKNLIYEKANAHEIRRHGMKDGMRLLIQDGIRKVILGQTDFDQIRKVTMV